MAEIPLDDEAIIRYALDVLWRTAPAAQLEAFDPRLTPAYIRELLDRLSFQGIPEGKIRVYPSPNSPIFPCKEVTY